MTSVVLSQVFAEAIYQHDSCQPVVFLVLLIIIIIIIISLLIFSYVGLGGLGVTYSHRDPRFAGSNPVEVDGFFQDVTILSTLTWGSRF